MIRASKNSVRSLTGEPRRDTQARRHHVYEHGGDSGFDKIVASLAPKE
jgi:hypothetical protein